MPTGRHPLDEKEAPSSIEPVAVAGERASQSASTQRLHWRRGDIKSQPHGPHHRLNI
jgi:hypothetical protein